MQTNIKRKIKMGLYSSFSTAQYYDEEPVKKEQKPKQPSTQEIKKPNSPMISEKKRKSLYDEAMKVASSESEYKGPDFRDVYRVGQKVAIQSPSGEIRTGNGRIAEIVANNLMYVWMEDTYRDVNDQWLAEFVTDKDKVIPL
jgi:hypothetical protein